MSDLWKSILWNRVHAVLMRLSADGSRLAANPGVTDTIETELLDSCGCDVDWDMLPYQRAIDWDTYVFTESRFPESPLIPAHRETYDLIPESTDE